MLWIFRLVLVSTLGYVYKINAQFSSGCTLGWEQYGDRCYRFETNSKAVFEEADAACWASGGSLLTVKTLQEHRFISDWLMKNGLYESDPWYTSGIYRAPYVIWEGDTSLDTMAPTYWVNNVNPPNKQKLIHVVYVRGSDFFGGYSWSLVSSSIAANYICEVARDNVLEAQIMLRNFTYGLGNVDVKDVPKAPHMLMQPNTILVLDTVKSVFIECAADGNPYPNYKWLKNGKEITSKRDIRYTLSAGRFSIQNPISTDQGTYQCQASNKYGITLSSPAKISFGYLRSFSPIKPEDVSANKFEGTRISCNAPEAFPDRAYMWFMYDTQQPIFENHKSMFMSQSGYLYLSEVQPTDQRQYFCVVTLTSTAEYINKIGIPTSRTGIKFWLIVSGKEHGYFKPYIYTHVIPTPAIRGARIRIECIAYGSLPLVYSWRREDGRPFEPNTVMTDLDRVLTIENAQLSAEGNYICTVNGHAGATSEVVTLSVEAKPYFPYDIGDRFVDPGQMLKWRCKASAQPRATYSWYKDGVMITVISGQIEVRDNYLWIQNVQAERDEGMYQCAATNIHGTTFSSGQLKVLSFKPTFAGNFLPPLIQIPQGGNYSIPCRVEGAPIPEVTWLKNGGQLSLTPGDVSSHLGMTIFNDLIINNIEFSDQGIYMCKATNINGDAMSSSQVTVSPGITILRKPEKTTVQVNTTAFIYCQASYDSLIYDLTYVWRLNGHTIDFKTNIFFIQSKQNGLDGLYIRNAQFEHTGTYTCEATTSMHKATASTDLTVQGPPGATAGVHVRTPLINNTATVIWTITSEINHGFPIERYDVEAEIGLYPGKWSVVAADVMESTAVTNAATLNLRSDQRMVVVQNLLPQMYYSFRVRAINVLGKSDKAGESIEQVKTNAQAPITIPRNIRGKEDAKVRTLHILWDSLDPSEYAGDGIGYYVYFKQENDPKEWFKAIVLGAQNASYSHLVGKEYYYMPYLVKVAAYNNLGHGPNSTIHTVMSAEEMPIATVIMQDSENFNESSFLMTWIPIQDTRQNVMGHLKGYRLRYWNQLTPDFITWRDVYGQANSALIIGLDPNAKYWGSVQVMNFAGVGPIGELRWGQTWHLAPLNYPRHVKVFPHTISSVLVQWQGISTSLTKEESLEGYYVRVWKVQEDIRGAVNTKVGKEEQAIVENLQSKTVYVMRVLGYSRGGDGSLSPHVYFTVEGGSLIFDSTTTQICYSQIECSGTMSLQTSILSFLLMYIVYIFVV